MLKLDAKDRELLLLSMINSAYELNHIIPNIELIVFKMFVSPVTTRSERKGADEDDILKGNLFHSLQDFKMPRQVYLSLLQSVALNPKKKHFKKIVQYLILHEKAKDVDVELIDLITFIGMDQKYPVLLGSTLKFMI